MSNFNLLVALFVSVLSTVFLVAQFTSTTCSAFQPTTYPHSQSSHHHHHRLTLEQTSCLYASRDEDKNGQEKKKRSFWDALDDVVDDFVMKRMGAGEQWYGQRKNNPSGNFDGKYEGGGRSDAFQIEIAKIQREEMELKKQRRLAAAAEEEEARRKKKL
mmetsp:Transcript_23062/g.54730  ORF Transcript_23062/g.54730 Transcript_23062/m.54730 type:complete len:159 (-) Transcript_23062:959-1435(-)